MTSLGRTSGVCFSSNNSESHGDRAGGRYEGAHHNGDDSGCEPPRRGRRRIVACRDCPREGRATGTKEETQEKERMIHRVPMFVRLLAPRYSSDKKIRDESGHQTLSSSAACAFFTYSRRNLID